jgi:uncharacterized FlaG/YvyC family protein
LELSTGFAQTFSFVTDKHKYEGICSFSERFEMVISSANPSIDLLPRASQVPAAEKVQRRQLMQAAKTVNESGLFGNNQIVFAVDSATHRPVIRIEDRDTHEVIQQLPPEYVLELAQNLGASSSQIMSPSVDM